MTDYVGDYQKHWSNVHYFFQSNDFVLTTVRIWSTGADMDVDGFMNSLVKNSYYDLCLERMPSISICRAVKSSVVSA